MQHPLQILRLPIRLAQAARPSEQFDDQAVDIFSESSLRSVFGSDFFDLTFLNLEQHRLEFLQVTSA